MIRQRSRADVAKRSISTRLPPLIHITICLMLCAGFSLPVQRATAQAAGDHDPLTMTTDAVAPLRFIAAHGQQAVMMGYPGQGLEMWAYPVQILSNYGIDIRSEGAARATPGNMLLRRIEVRPQETTRIYVGPNFVLRERLFVPLDQPGAIVTYTVEGRQPVEIMVHFTPVLDLMWPAGIGGQSVEWHDALGHAADSTLGGYALSEPLHRFSAAIVSPNTVAHDSTENSAVRAQQGMAFTIRPAGTEQHREATVFMGLDQGPAAGATVQELITNQAKFEAQATEHYAALTAKALRITTPDPQINQALAWAEIALDQAWVCDGSVGCGLVAGYGPSHNARRPQYDWFFAGDGLIATDGLVAAGESDRARQELEFILRYQDAKSGMIWHELSQSAGYLDWLGKYPYMYVHVDVTYQFLGTVARYVAASGDVDFARQHWAALESAYHYCRSQIDPGTSLPRIPEGKEGGNEQDRMSDDLGLSSEWLTAAASFAELASATGHAEQADEARHAEQAAGPAIAKRYWDGTRRFWISGYTEVGKPIFEERSGPGGLIAKGAFAPEQSAILLDTLASADFQADWGTRGVSAAAKTYDPDSYARGSIFALGTSAMASTYWMSHRPVTAEAIWRTLPPLNWLDALGHMHEVLAGDFYHQQAESVPEQTWSSAGFLTATVHGLLGLEVQGAADRVVFAPHLPPEWQHLSVDHVRTAHAILGLTLARAEQRLQLDVSNKGSKVAVTFDPEIPLGARILQATCNGHSLPATLEQHAQDEHARMDVQAQPGATHCELRYRGGVQLVPDAPNAQVGDASHGLKMMDVSLKGEVLTVEADAHAGEVSGFELSTAGKPEVPYGARLEQLSANHYRVTLAAVAPGSDKPGSGSGDGKRGGYQHQTVDIRIGDIEGKR